MSHPHAKRGIVTLIELSIMLSPIAKEDANPDGTSQQYNQKNTLAKCQQ